EGVERVVHPRDLQARHVVAGDLRQRRVVHVADAVVHRPADVARRLARASRSGDQRDARRARDEPRGGAWAARAAVRIRHHGVASGGTRFFVACSNAYAISISRGSLHAPATNAAEKGTGFGAKPSGTTISG